MLLSVFALFLFAFSASAQKREQKEEYTGTIIDHKVTTGETMMMVSKKYLVKPEDIYDMNPDAVNGLQPNTILKIPADKKLGGKAQPVANRKKHVTAPTGN